MKSHVSFHHDAPVNDKRPSEASDDPIIFKIISSLIRICGGGIQTSAIECIQPPVGSIVQNCPSMIVGEPQGNRHFCHLGNANNTDKDHSFISWKAQLEMIVLRSISYPQKGKSKDRRHHSCQRQDTHEEYQVGKPHDIEVKAALSFFHYFRNKLPTTQSATDSRRLDKYSNGLEIISDLGLVRSIQHPLELAKLIVEDLENSLWQERVNENEKWEPKKDSQVHECTRTMGLHASHFESFTSDLRFPYEIKYDASGIICIVTPERNAFLRSASIHRLPCPHRQCTKWLKGEKGLWWHQTREHGKVYSDAVGVARDGSKDGNDLAIVVYLGPCENVANSLNRINGDPGNSLQTTMPMNGKTDVMKQSTTDPLFQSILDGNMSKLKACVTALFEQDDTIQVASYLDKNGASALHWAAGCGHLNMVQYLITECNVPPDQAQLGKRSFRNRTPLHWAARNGHLNVVKYLVEDCSRTHHRHVVDIDAETLDGTTAFCWACWQGHEDVMQYLYSKGANTTKLNSYGCNAVLWAAQSTACGLLSIKWLRDIGLDMEVVNTNGHGMLHKSAQRGKEDVCQWILDEYLTQVTGDISRSLLQIGPDAEGFCPSDLAGVEGYVSLAEWLVTRESEIAFQAYSCGVSPQWLLEGISNARHVTNRYGLEGIYESGSGINKMSAFILDSIEGRI